MSRRMGDCARAGLALLALTTLALAADATDAMNAMFYGRAIERLIIVGFAGLSLVLGYRLFRVTTIHDGELQAKGGSYTLKMTRIGPGVVFALFGCSVLAYSLYVAPKAGIEAKSSGTQITNLSGALGGRATPTTNREYLEALQTISYNVGLANFGEASRKTLVERMVQRLEPLKAALVDEILGAGRYAEWFQLNQIQTTNPSEFAAKLGASNALRQRYTETDQLLQQVAAP